MTQRRVVGAALALLVLFFALATLGPCGIILPVEPVLTAPQADMVVESNASAATVTVLHNGGNTLTAGNTTALFLRFTDAETGTTATVRWAPDGRGAFPVTPGETVTVMWQRAAAWVDTGDTVAVVWRGHNAKTPRWCPNNTPTNTTLGQTTV